MHILLYAETHHKIRPALRKTIAEEMPEAQVEEYGDIEAFRKRFLRPKTSPLVAVIAPLHFNDLKRIQSLDHLLHDTKVILILPDRDDLTIRCAHLLRPRFLSFADNQISWVVEVLKRMMSLYRRPEHATPFDGAADTKDSNGKDGARRGVPVEHLPEPLNP